MIQQSKEFLHGADVYLQDDAETAVDHSHDNDEDHVYVSLEPKHQFTCTLTLIYSHDIATTTAKLMCIQKYIYREPKHSSQARLNHLSFPIRYARKMAEFLAMAPASASKVVASEMKEIIDLDPVDEVGHFQVKALINQVGSKGLLYGGLEHPHQDGENFLAEQ